MVMNKWIELQGKKRLGERKMRRERRERREREKERD
jgi:hypothetical protein